MANGLLGICITCGHVEQLNFLTVCVCFAKAQQTKNVPYHALAFVSQFLVYGHLVGKGPSFDGQALGGMGQTVME